LTEKKEEEKNLSIGEKKMSVLKKILIVLVVTSLVFLIGCQVMLGLDRDIRDTTDGIDRMFTPVEQKLKRDRVERAAQLVLENKRD